MKKKFHIMTYLMECPGYWWSRRRKVWVSGEAPDLNAHLPYSSCRILKTKNKALQALGQAKHIPGAFVERELTTKKGHVLMDRWTNRGEDESS